ncbi:MAG: hypothetical protein ACT4PQ_12675 [Betaproteobacteria bacterium]
MLWRKASTDFSWHQLTSWLRAYTQSAVHVLHADLRRQQGDVDAVDQSGQGSD